VGKKVHTIVIIGNFNMNVVEKLSLLRAEMALENLDAWIIPSSDPHASEYLTDRWLGRKWISGFSGSAGTVVILKERAGLWTDGRYHIQAEEELAGSNIELFKDGLPETISFIDWIFAELSESSRVGFDGEVLSWNFKKELSDKCNKKNIFVVNDKDILDKVWKNRPAMTDAQIFELPIEYAGKSRLEKLGEVRKEMEKSGATHHFVSSLDDIAWLYNFRGQDTDTCPVALSYTLISMENAQLFIAGKKVPDELKLAFEKDNIQIINYGDVDNVITNLAADAKVLFDHNCVNSKLAGLIPETCEKLDEISITTTLKAIKNSVEIDHFRACHIKDGAAVVRFLKWLDENVASGQVSELSASAQLESYRQEIDTFKGLSFTTIPGYGANGAMMHYASTEQSNCTIGRDNFFLVDSGGQYFDGTTDITRTMCYGDMSDSKKHDFTLVVKGHIQLAIAKFMQGTRGIQLDMLARQPLWKHAINYGCGTGHGVGFFLNVHEGPHSISLRFIDEALKPGMCVTNEPGIYRAGQHGIRIENIMLVVDYDESEFGTFYKFEQLTMCPVDTRALLVDLLLPEEKEYLNNYHKEVFEKLSPVLTESEINWLRQATRPV
jgi:Xaa-Pro aminopeptidase